METRRVSAFALRAASSRSVESEVSQRCRTNGERRSARISAEHGHPRQRRRPAQIRAMRRLAETHLRDGIGSACG